MSFDDWAPRANQTQHVLYPADADTLPRRVGASVLLIPPDRQTGIESPTTTGPLHGGRLNLVTSQPRRPDLQAVRLTDNS